MLSWLISDESFFPKTDWLSSFRLRATYGASGVQPSTTAATRYFSSTTRDDQRRRSAGRHARRRSATRTSSRNTRASSRRASTRRLFNSRTTFEFTYYNKKTKDALIARPLAPSLAGIQTLFDNLGSIRNQGIELTLNNRIIDNNEFGFDLQLTGSTNKNRILALGEGVTPIVHRQPQRRSTTRRAIRCTACGARSSRYNDANDDGFSRSTKSART